MSGGLNITANLWSRLSRLLSKISVTTRFEELMTDKIISLKPSRPPLVLQLGENTMDCVILRFNRKLTAEEFEFFFETSMRTVHLMRGIELK